MSDQLLYFDMHTLHAALDEKRHAANLSWLDLTNEVNQPFKYTSSIPISVGTIRDLRNKSSVTSAVVLQALRWLGRTPESFLAGRQSAPAANEGLPDPGPTRILRFDTAAMHAALNAERIKRGMKWKQVAADLPGFTEGTLTNLAKGPLIGFPRVMMIPQWLHLPAATFVHGHSW